MAVKTEVPITGSVLAWALDEAGMKPEDLAARLKVLPATVDDWISEAQRPGKTEFGKIIDAVRRPSAIFFMPQPPRQAGLPASFRLAPGPAHHVTSTAALREMRKARRIQQVMAWLLRGQESTTDLPIVDYRSVPAVVAGQRMRARVGVTLENQASWRDMPAALREWRSVLDDLNVLTFSLQLGKDDIRGFSIWDDRAPIVAVNTAYNEAARIFTMAHELGHVLTRSETACFDWVAPDSETDADIERWCEQFAAAFLLPPEQLVEFVRRVFGVTAGSPVEDFDTAARVARRLKVSVRALTLALIGAGLAPSSLYRLVDSRAQVVDRPRDSGGGGGGVPTAVKRVNQYGPRVSRTVTQAVASGALGLRDAADYLDVTLGDLQDISTAVLGGSRIGD